MLNTYMPTLHHLLLPANIEPMTSLYVASAHDALRSMISSMSGASGPLKSFVIPPAYRAAAHAAFGPKFPAEDSYPLFRTFDDSFYLLGTNIPRMFLSKPVKAWEEVIDLIERYIAKQEKAGDELTPFTEVALEGKKHAQWARSHLRIPT